LAEKHRAVLLLGSNLGDSKKLLSEAKSRIEKSIGEVLGSSKIYNTAPWGKTDQPPFLNQALLVETELSPEIILNRIKQIEHALGRERIEKWGARLIDIDILLIDDLVYFSSELAVPHPHLHERRFSLIPLQDVWPDWEHPVRKQSIEKMLETCSDTGAVDSLQQDY
jgi:2-amino-4-hydroxy-6-hydroxymethyldihydropteridine diphosphokinase